MSKYIRTNLAVLRAMRGNLSQRRISQATGITQKTLSALETGTSRGIEFNTLLKLCTFLRCTPNDLLVIEDEPEEIEPVSQEALSKADELIAKGLKMAMAVPIQTPEEIWAEFENVRSRIQASAARLNERKHEPKSA